MVGINVPIPVPMAYYSFGGWKSSLFGDAHVHGREGDPLLHARQGGDEPLARPAPPRRQPRLPADEVGPRRGPDSTRQSTRPGRPSAHLNRAERGPPAAARARPRGCEGRGGSVRAPAWTTSSRSSRRSSSATRIDGVTAGARRALDLEAPAPSAAHDEQVELGARVRRPEVALAPVARRGDATTGVEGEALPRRADLRVALEVARASRCRAARAAGRCRRGRPSASAPAACRGSRATAAGRRTTNVAARRSR